MGRFRSTAAAKEVQRAIFQKGQAGTVSKGRFVDQLHRLLSVKAIQIHDPDIALRAKSDQQFVYAVSVNVTIGIVEVIAVIHMVVADGGMIAVEIAFGGVQESRAVSADHRLIVRRDAPVSLVCRSCRCGFRGGGRRGFHFCRHCRFGGRLRGKGLLYRLGFCLPAGADGRGGTAAGHSYSQHAGNDFCSKRLCA